MKVYIINTESKITGSVKVSQEGYASMEAAQKFISHRAGSPEKVTDWLYESENYLYQIVEVSIEKENPVKCWNT